MVSILSQTPRVLQRKSGSGPQAVRGGIILISMLVLAFSAACQEIRMSATVDSNHIMIGDWFRLRIEMEYPSGVTASNPLLPDSMDGFELIKPLEPQISQAGERTRRIHDYILTSFDSGMHIIPAIGSHYTSGGDTAFLPVETSPVVITVGTLAVDTSLDIKDVKPPLSVPITFGDILPYLIGLVGAAGAFWLVRYVIRKRKKGESLIPSAPPRPADEVALEALRSLESEKLWQRGKVKEFHSQLTGILRLYIERKFRILALESTSEEILEALGDGKLESGSRAELRELLERADLVKFAKSQPLPEENDKSLAIGFRFVQDTSGAAITAQEPTDGREVSS